MHSLYFSFEIGQVVTPASDERRRGCIDLGGKVFVAPMGAKECSPFFIGWEKGEKIYFR
jgi:hypothetical protein